MEEVVREVFEMVGMWKMVQKKGEMVIHAESLLHPSRMTAAASAYDRQQYDKMQKEISKKIQMLAIRLSRELEKMVQEKLAASRQACLRAAQIASMESMRTFINAIEGLDSQIEIHERNIDKIETELRGIPTSSFQDPYASEEIQELKKRHGELKETILEYCDDLKTARDAIIRYMNEMERYNEESITDLQHAGTPYYRQVHDNTSQIQGSDDGEMMDGGGELMRRLERKVLEELNTQVKAWDEERLFKKIFEWTKTEIQRSIHSHVDAVVKKEELE
ncbi:hypothetical protein HDU67_007207 [Dinochytrium kinnereticum]|nr:hypothetical protein HDU67_007207 [Dinochytrium kinnereticum]